ncbi:hypothetical protein ZIOFF_022709 [Zingiber officinale]|uniref:MADS-box domain-containing protein n=1 Tax=Zingiber officinale TaxID=94328 RepID=A0A8J5HDX3_ZINOF|nr:hypothetical protein ZIOFF_022709 [Zingiber officinale]
MLGWIAHDATRRATFKKWKRSLLKKVSELATLCSIDACAVVYGPEEEAPEVWPSPAETTRAAELVRLAEMKLALVRNRVEREKARTAVEPPRQVVEQVVGMAVGPLIEFVKTPGQAVEQAVDMAEDPWIGFVLPSLQAVEQAVGTVEPEAEDETLNWLAEDPWIGFVLPPLQAVEQAVGTVEPEAEDETLNWLAEDPWIGFVLPPLQAVEQAVGTVELEAEDETLNWLVEALNAGEIAPFAEALSCIDQEPWEENMAAAETEEEVDTLNWLVEAAGENAPSPEVGRQEDMALCCISEEAVDPWMEFVEKMFGAVPLSCFAPESVERDHLPWRAPLVLINNNFDC